MHTMLQRGARALVMVLLGACAPGSPASGVSDIAEIPMPVLRSPQGRSPVIAAAGDLVCARAIDAAWECRHDDVARLVDELAPDALLLLGDIQYEAGELRLFRSEFDPSFGRFRSITRPVPGNHEYSTLGARGYFDYFNGEDSTVGIAGPRSRGYYSYDLGNWHLVALNSNCGDVGCGPGSAQERWLRADLARHPTQCLLAYAHHPRFTSGLHGDAREMATLWNALAESNADLMLAGHDHEYERLAPMRADGTADSVAGIRSFVVGTGGRNMRAFGRIRANSEVRNNETFGVLAVTLDSASYSWRFVDASTRKSVDAGTGRCKGRPRPST